MPSDPDILLDRLVDHAARGFLTAAEGPALRLAVQGLREELEQARRTAGGLGAKVRKLGGELKRADALINELAAPPRRHPPRRAQRHPRRRPLDHPRDRAPAPD
ncbi:hypothetical protein [Kitasatospora sp. GP82]|uniref:hypothetical protein n=1 Tax=Kitasatospora sp. GP82 TaxID=3035089 RepID=UPI002476C470|nr:hypothetical protein [Kitasatospora sp. GP82]MDH6126750.1 hypothetical protein [Kitasatospora sp. GP82]